MSTTNQPNDLSNNRVSFTNYIMNGAYMTWEELYPVVKEQAYYAVMRYDPRRKDKMQELVCQAYEKYKNDIEAGVEPKLNVYKAFVQQRVKEVDIRSVCKKGLGGTSIRDVLSPYRRRPDQDVEIVEFDDWMTTSTKKKELVEDSFTFPIDFRAWLLRLKRIEKKVLNYLLEGYVVSKIAEMVKLTRAKTEQVIKSLQIAYLSYFRISLAKP